MKFTSITSRAHQHAHPTFGGTMKGQRKPRRVNEWIKTRRCEAEGAGVSQFDGYLTTAPANFPLPLP
jgi:hypothetical protein